MTGTNSNIVQNAPTTTVLKYFTLTTLITRTILLWSGKAFLQGCSGSEPLMGDSPNLFTQGENEENKKFSDLSIALLGLTHRPHNIIIVVIITIVVVVGRGGVNVREVMQVPANQLTHPPTSQPTTISTGHTRLCPLRRSSYAARVAISTLACPVA